MKKPIKILLQTTIPFAENDWHIDRFSLLREHLASLKDENGSPLFEVAARNLELNEEGNDRLLSALDESDFDELCDSIHELLQKPDGGVIEYFPAHPHEGGVGVPENEMSARVVARGKSKISGKDFNLIVAFERSEDRHGNRLGRGIAESSFHHLVDYNWDVRKGCPDFVEEAPGEGYRKNPRALNDVKTYVENLAKWLAPEQQP
ncbi:MAG TPA: hypothetical protein VGB68_05795 [Pyrinomonadaceae bacterium]|jgi:hypothetical protein